MKLVLQIKKSILFMWLFLDFLGSTQAQTAPGGIRFPQANVPGVSYKLYTGTVNYANLITGTLTGATFKQDGYANTVYNLDTLFENELSANFTIVATSSFSVTSTGSYSFDMPGIDDAGVVTLNGTQAYRANITPSLGTVETVVTPIALTAGITYTLVVRYVGAVGTNNLRLNWKGNSVGLDVGTSYVQVADAKFSVLPQLGSWHKANDGIGVADGAAVSTWLDKSSNTAKTDMISTLGGIPIYKSSGATGGLLNFNPTVLFNDNCLVSNDDANNLAWGTQGNTKFVVNSITSADQGFITYQGRDDGGNTATYFDTYNGDLYAGYGIAVNPSTLGLFSNPYSKFFLSSHQYFNSNLTATNNNRLYVNGYLRGQTTIAADDASLRLNDNADFSIGGSNETVNTGTERIKGNIAEVINYPWALTVSERNRVESYLAIKYGATLGTTATTVDYVNSDGTTTWTGTSAYQNNIAGIGKDDASALEQKQSISNNGVTGGHPYGQVAIGLNTIANTNLLNTGSFSADKLFLVWGDNANTQTYATATSNFTYNGSTTNKRVNRIWRAQNSSVTDSVMVNVSKTIWGASAPTLTGCGQLVMIIASDAAFTSIVKVVPVSDAVGTLEGFARIQAKTTMPSGVSFFTFGMIDNGFPGVVNLPTVAMTTAVDPNTCSNGTWTYYYDATARTKKIFAIDWNGNTPPASVTGVVSYNAGHHSVTSGINTTTIMGRLLTITPAGGSFTVNGGVKLRFFYSPSELAASEALTGSPLVSQRWFKNAADASTTISNNNGIQIAGNGYLTVSATGTEDAVNYVEFNNITSFSTFGYASKKGVTVLNLKLLNFMATEQENSCNVAINWKIEGEDWAKSFQVENSANGIDFTVVSSINPSTNLTAYKYVHANNQRGVTYYRLKITDINGKVTYSKVVALNNVCDGKSVLVYPNPASTMFTVNANGFTKSSIGKLYNSTGQLVKEMVLNNGKTEVNCQKLSSGMYKLVIVSNNGQDREVYNIQVIK
jgi:trimeric autotransporter adhesin